MKSCEGAFELIGYKFAKKSCERILSYTMVKGNDNNTYLYYKTKSAHKNGQANGEHTTLET